MDDYGPTTYGESWADMYDEPLLGWPPADSTVRFLADRCAGGTALELGVGTGRVAIPLALQGIRVFGVDASPAMLRVLRAKPDAGLVTTICATFDEYDDPAHYDLIYCVGQSFLQLQDAAAQLRTLRWVAAHLQPSGCFVMDALVPDPRRFRMRQDLMTNAVRPDEVLMTAAVHDALRQVVRSNTIRIGPEGLRLFPNFIRYCTPAELIWLADAAGLAMTGRWSSFGLTPFTGRPGAYVCEFRLKESYRVTPGSGR